jgi:hypothetical protein
MALWRIENGQVHITPHAGQQAALDSRARFTFVIAGSGGGKTSLTPWWLYREIGQCGEGDYLAVTATFDLFKLRFLPEMRHVFCDTLNWGAFAAGDKVITSHDGKSRIILRSAEAEGGLESAIAKAAVLDECGQDRFTLDAWDAVQRRLSLNQGRVLGATTPYSLGWLKTEVHDRWRAGDQDYKVIQFESVANPAFPAQEFERRRRTMPAWRFNMFYRGQFERPESLIYSVYDPTTCDVEPFEIPKEWPRYVGLDFGANNMALVWVAEDVAKAAYYVYRESLEGGKTTAEHARQALELAVRERVIGWYGGAASEKQQRWDWGEQGVSIYEPMISDVEAGISRVYSLFKTRQLFVFKTCRRLRDELGTYQRVTDASGLVTEKIKDKERFHLLDALRYAAPALGGSGPLVMFA